LSLAVSVFELGDAVTALPQPEALPERHAVPVVERRGPNRAKNVVRLPPTSDGDPAERAAKATTAHDSASAEEWQQF
jgi:hypothetical protein